jgi:hypothetical protein
MWPEVAQKDDDISGASSSIGNEFYFQPYLSQKMAYNKNPHFSTRVGTELKKNQI